MRTQGVATAIVLVFAVAVVAYIAARTTGIVRFWPFTAGEFVQLITPLFLVALFIERVLEVFISGWRGLETKRHKEDVTRKMEALEAAKQGASPNVSTEQAALGEAKGVLTGYKAETQRWAFAASVFLGLVAAALGVRAFGLFVDPGEFEDLRAGQRLGFHIFDVIMTAGVLAGGSDALHQLVATFTTFMERSKDRAKNVAP